MNAKGDRIWPICSVGGGDASHWDEVRTEIGRRTGRRATGTPTRCDGKWPGIKKPALSEARAKSVAGNLAVSVKKNMHLLREDSERVA